MKRGPLPALRSPFLYLLCAVVLASALTGCASGRAIIDRGAVGKIIWPGPPEKPRIKYLWSVSVISGKEKNGLAEIVLGEPGESADPRTSPRLLRPYGIFVDGDMMYVADPGALRVTIINMQTGETRNILRADKSEFLAPVGIVVYKGVIYVSDSALRKVFMLDGKGRLLGEFHSTFKRPTSLAIDRTRGIIYVADTLSHTIDRFDLNGVKLGVIGGRGTGKGQFNFPTHLWVDKEDRLYVTDEMNFRVQIFSREGKFIGMFGTPGDAWQDFQRPKGVATDMEGHIYVVDSMAGTVKIFDRKGGLLLFFGQEGERYGDFYLPTGIFIDGNDKIYVADTYNARVQVFQYVGGKEDK